MPCPGCQSELPAAATHCPVCGVAVAQHLAGAATLVAAATPIEAAGVMPTLLAASSAPTPLPRTQAHDVVPAAKVAPAPVPKLSVGAPLAAADPLIGQVIAGRFRVDELLGAGGMGTVYRAEQLAVGRPVVLKFLHARLSQQADLAERFQREALAVSHLSSPNTIVLYDFGTAEDGRLYMAMELLEGRTLADLIAAAGPLPPLRAIALTLQILGSLAEAHAKGIIHRDLKPENIMLVQRSGTSDFVKVLDFGIAKIVGEEEPTVSPVEAARRRAAGAEADDAEAVAALAAVASGLRHSDSQLTQQGAVFGSPRYMSPEQAMGEKIDARTDLYAVGMMLYELLSGRPPFTAENTLRLLHDQAHTKVPPLTEAHPQLAVAAELSAIVAGCLEKNAADRPASASALADELRAVTDVVVRQHAAEERALLELVGVRRRWRRGPLIGGLVALVLFAALGGWLLWRRGDKGGPEGRPLASGDRLFVSAQGPLPSWAHYDGSQPLPPGVARVQDAPSEAEALALAEALAAARLLDVPLRFEPDEGEPFRRDLSRLLETYRTARERLRVEGHYWVKLAIAGPGGAVAHRFDGYVKLARPSAVQRVELRRVLAVLRYENGQVQFERLVIRRRCEEARRLAAEVAAAIDDSAELPRRKQFMRNTLQHKLRPCQR